MAKTLIGIIPKYKGEFTTENYKSVTFQRMNYAKIGKDYYQSLADDNLGVELTDTNKWARMSCSGPAQAAETAANNANAAADSANTAAESANTASTSANAAANKANKASEDIRKLVDKERVTITLAINQDENILGKKVYVKSADDDSVLSTLEWQGSALIAEVKPDQKYYVEAEAIEGYAPTKSENMTAVWANSKSVELEYKCTYLYPSFLSSDGKDIGDTKCDLLLGESTRKEVNYSAGVLVKIPWGSEYRLVPAVKDGYMPMGEIAGTADQKKVSQSVTYKEVPFGIFIQMTDGTLVKAEDYDEAKYPKDNVNGIYVATSYVTCVMLAEAPVSKPWNPQVPTKPSILISGVDTTKRGRLGEQNTRAVVDYYGYPYDTYACGYAFSKVMKSGKRCYLPALDELAQLYYNKDAINACSQKILGADIITGTWKWSSTLYSASYAWRFSSDAGTNNRADSSYVLPVSAL